MSALSVPLTLNHFGAGILPYTEVSGGRKLFLLGKEKWGRDRNCWCSFGGTKKANETPEETAIREFTEETRGIIASSDELREQLKLPTTYCVVTRDRSKNSSKAYYHFLIKIPYESIDSLRERFFKALNDAPTSDYMEKSDLRWASAEELLSIYRGEMLSTIRLRPCFREGLTIFPFLGGNERYQWRLYQKQHKGGLWKRQHQHQNMYELQNSA